MNNKYFIGSKAKNVTVGAKLTPISKIILSGENDSVFVVGDDTGYAFSVYVPNATQQMAEDMHAKAVGFQYQGYKATNVFIPPEAELGDAVVINGIQGMLANREFSFTPKMSAGIGSPYNEEVNHEFQYTGNYAQELANRVKLGNFYYGVQITKQNGIVIEKTNGEDVCARAVFNSDELSFYDANNNRVLYFDPTTGTYRFTGELNVSDNFIVDAQGNVTMNGNVTITGSLKLTGGIDWLQVRYSTDKDADIPSGWSEDWDDSWSNTTTKVWAIYSYDGGTSWTWPMLVQGSEGPKGSDANVPEWVQAYTASAQFNTLITDEWVVTMNLYASKMFGGSIYATNFYADAEANTFVNVKSDGFYLYHTDVEKPKAALTTNNAGDLIQLILGAGTDVSSSTYGRMFVEKSTTSGSIYYISESTGEKVGFTFNNDNSITIHGDLKITTVFA